MFQCDFSAVSVSECVSSAHRAVLKYSSHSHVNLLLLLQPRGGSREREGTREKRRRDRAPLYPSFPLLLSTVFVLISTFTKQCSVSALSHSLFLTLFFSWQIKATAHISPAQACPTVSAVLYQRGTDTPFVFFCLTFTGFRVWWLRSG